MPWGEFIRIHWDVLIATDFFTTEARNGLRLVLSVFFMLFLRLNCHALCVTAITALCHARGMLPRIQGCRSWHAAAERWGVLVRARGGARLPLGDTELGRPSLSACATHNHLDRPLQDLGTLVLLPSTSCRQIRDGPMRSHHRCGGLLGYPYRKAA
jgi:hypothetical protein